MTNRNNNNNVSVIALLIIGLSEFLFANKLEITYSLCGMSSSGSAITVDVLSLQINNTKTHMIAYT